MVKSARTDGQIFALRFSFVAAVNKDTSKKFQGLVGAAEGFIRLLPWGAAFEKDVFLKPDYTALEVIAFGTSAYWLGQNLRNYDEIRQNFGFKNLSFCNIASSLPRTKAEFLSADDEDVFWRYRGQALEMQVGLHELLGHGTGKLFECVDGKFNFDRDAVKNPFTGKPVTSWYEKGESWTTKFGRTSKSAARKASATSSAATTSIFGYEGVEAVAINYANWMTQIRAGLLGLETYSPESGSFGNAHCCARYVLLRVCMAADRGLVSIEECTDADGKPDLKFRLDRSKILTVGKQAVADFLLKLQVYKSTGNAEEGIKFFQQWSAVGEEQLRWRDIVLARRQPRRLLVQPNTVLDHNGEVQLRTYSDSFEGLVQSFVERHSPESVQDLLSVWKEDAAVFGLP